MNDGESAFCELRHKLQLYVVVRISKLNESVLLSFTSIFGQAPHTQTAF